jgi:hypothetical protein
MAAVYGKSNVSGAHTAFIFRAEVNKGRMFVGNTQVGKGMWKEAQEDRPVRGMGG